MKTLLFALALLIVPTGAQAETLPSLEWPVDGITSLSDVSDPFGPRLLDGEYDFHAGIDIPVGESDPVRAAADGEVFRIYPSSDPDSPYSSNTVILRHDADFSFETVEGTQDITRFYTLYLHLTSFNESLSEGDDINVGDILGYGGTDGSTYSHVHFEVRLQTTCRKWSDCNSTGFDPNVNPLTWMEYSYTDDALATLSLLEDEVIEYHLYTNEDAIDVNAITLTARDEITLEQDAARTVNFNTRESINTTSADAIDESSYNGVELDPGAFTTSSLEYDLAVRFSDVVTDATSQCVDITVHTVSGREVDVDPIVDPYDLICGESTLVIPKEEGVVGIDRGDGLIEDLVIFPNAAAAPKVREINSVYSAALRKNGKFLAVFNAKNQTLVDKIKLRNKSTMNAFRVQEDGEGNMYIYVLSALPNKKKARLDTYAFTGSALEKQSTKRIQTKKNVKTIQLRKRAERIRATANKKVRRYQYTSLR